jgi:threonine/homoserine/homoserine lactone efflux protein
VTLSALLALALAQALLAMSPGPATVLTMQTAASRGVKAGLRVALGLTLGVLAWALAALVGLSLLFEMAPWLQTGLRVAGGLFLVWIGISLWRGARRPMPEPGAAAPGFAGVRVGITTNLANPKALAYFAAVFTGILPPDPNVADGLAILALIFVVELGWSSTVAAIFSRRGPRAAYARAKLWADRAFGVVIGTLGLRLLLDRS